MNNGETSNEIKACTGVKAVLRFFMCGPSTATEGLVWGLMMPVTLPVLFVSQFLIGICEVVAGTMNGTIVCVDGGGNGMFDEVSCRRREDIKFLLGQGDYDH